MIGRNNVTPYFFKNMLEVELSVDAVGSSETYDSQQPTKQNELLALELRKILASVSGYKIYLPQDADVSGLDSTINGIMTAIETASTQTVEIEEGQDHPLDLLPSDVVSDSWLTGIVGTVLSGLLPPQYAWLVKIGAWLLPRIIRDNVRMDREGGTAAMLEAVQGVQAAVESLEVQIMAINEAKSVAIMHTSESDKVVYIHD